MREPPSYKTALFGCFEKAQTRSCKLNNHTALDLKVLQNKDMEYVCHSIYLERP